MKPATPRITANLTAHAPIPEILNFSEGWYVSEKGFTTNAVHLSCVGKEKTYCAPSVICKPTSCLEEEACPSLE